MEEMEVIEMMILEKIKYEKKTFIKIKITLKNWRNIIHDKHDINGLWIKNDLTCLDPMWLVK